MKTKFLKLVVLLLVTATVLEGCRKGENDPLISLRSRDARVTGDWKLVEFESTRTDFFSSGNMTFTDVRTTSYDGTTWTTTNPGGTNSYSYSRNLLIEKDGTYIYSETNDGDYEEESGRWSWLNDAKNKRRILLDNHGISYIDQLKNSEMVFVEEYEDSYTDADGETGTFTFTSRAVYEKQK
jgi:hypothetical protein